MTNAAKRLVITKRIAKHGRQSVIVIPKDLENLLKPGSLTQLTIDLIDENTETGVQGK
jgi:hypothetical protein